MSVPTVYRDTLCAQVDTELFFPDKGGAQLLDHLRTSEAVA